jgi:hypothetical protein
VKSISTSWTRSANRLDRSAGSSTKNLGFGVGAGAVVPDQPSRLAAAPK